MSRPVTLAMYDAGGAATAALWEDLRDRLETEGLDGVPEDLTIPDDLESVWLAPDLLLGQTCGYPMRHVLAGRVRYVATPVYEVEGTDGPLYRSALVARADDPADELRDLRGRRAAYNSSTSQSGYNAFRDAVAPLNRDGRYFAETIATGSHANSVAAVIGAVADVAAIDPVSLALMPEEVRSQVKIVGWTEASPGLPYITALSTSANDVNTLRESISSALHAPSTAEARTYLMLTDIVVLGEHDYDVIIDMERRAIDRGYPQLA